MVRRTAQSFGWEWTQGWNKSTLGSDSIDLEIEKTQFLEKTRTQPPDLEGKVVLDAGCGFGRYSYVARSMGAQVVSVDVSNAVESAQRNLEGLGDCLVVQADLFSLPVAPSSFDFIFSLGVLHHTIDACGAFLNLVRLLRPGGEIAIWVYRRESPERELVFNRIREITLKLPYDTLLKVSEILALIAQSPALPAESKNRIPISSLGHNNFDWYSCPIRDHFTPGEVQSWFHKAGLADIEVYGRIHSDGYGGAIGAKGRCPR
ncbi:class I SAM-dependent methyltransferase [Acidobacteria bacterium AH-259-L09]|nr:class I SAM-dependent methyltransferase [Acidobacteria bacterium AH-259-L09]